LASSAARKRDRDLDVRDCILGAWPSRPDVIQAQRRPSGVKEATPHPPRYGCVRLILVAGLGLAVFAALDISFSAGPSFLCRFPSDGPLNSGITARAVDSGDRRRCYLVYAPPGLDPGQTAPVVLALHGFAGNAAGFRSIAGWETIADRERFIVVYPEGSSFPLRWNIGPAANIPTVDDIGYIQEVLQDLSEAAAIDSQRIYLTGFSNGGGMAHRIACQLSARIAAVGIVDAIDAGMLGSCPAKWPVPLMAFFGAANPLAGLDYPEWFQKLMGVSLELETPLPAGAIDMWVQAWANRNGCRKGPVTTPPVGSASLTRYEDCEDEADVVLYWIEGQGHSWPGGPAIPMLGDSVTDFNASEVLWAFFENHPRTPDS
jgi:polyhydroxybutyrate depolymerase